MHHIGRWSMVERCGGLVCIHHIMPPGQQAKQRLTWSLASDSMRSRLPAGTGHSTAVHTQNQSAPPT